MSSSQQQTQADTRLLTQGSPQTGTRAARRPWHPLRTRGHTAGFSAEGSSGLFVRCPTPPLVMN